MIYVQTGLVLVRLRGSEPQVPGQASLADIWNQLQYITVKTAFYTYLHLHISYSRSTHQKS